MQNGRILLSCHHFKKTPISDFIYFVSLCIFAVTFLDLIAYAYTWERTHAGIFCVFFFNAHTYTHFFFSHQCQGCTTKTKAKNMVALAISARGNNKNKSKKIWSHSHERVLLKIKYVCKRIEEQESRPAMRSHAGIANELRRSFAWDCMFACVV